MRTALALSGGVDSAVAALRLLAAGDEVMAVTMRLGLPQDEATVEAAAGVARFLGLRHRVVDLTELWQREVVGYVREAYSSGLTPNPCVRCNEFVKLAALPGMAFAEFGCDRFATGHYARLLPGGRLLRAADCGKDQSYFLYRVSREVLSRTAFPLGESTKAEVRAEAAAAGIPMATRSDSQDFCGGDPKAYVEAADRPGEVVDAGGKVLGEHRGFWHYTPGQRKGLGIGGGIPFYVLRTDPAANRVVVGTREEAVCRSLKLVDPVGEIDFSLPVKVRSAGEPRLLSDGIVGIAPGQSAVFYRGDEVVGGGIIAAGEVV